jgi:Protein of unknown function (DUF3987)
MAHSIALKSYRQVAAAMTKCNFDQGQTTKLNTYEISKTNSPYWDARRRRLGPCVFRPSPTTNNRHARLSRRDHNDRRTISPESSAGLWGKDRAVGGRFEALLAAQRGAVGTVSGYFDNLDALIVEFGKVAIAKGIYVTLNPVIPALLARRVNRLEYVKNDETTKDQHIVRRRWLLVDVDADRPSRISATNAEKEASHKKAREIHDYLKGRGWRLQVADSGNGYHLLARIDLPCDDGKLLEQVLAALANRFDGDGVKIDPSVHNEARIARLYGTLAAKGDNTEERPHRLSKILLAPLLVKVTAEQLQALVDELQPAKPPIQPPRRKSTAQNGKPDKAQVREMLAVIPKRPHYHDWIKILAAIGDALPDDEAIEVLNEWSPEERPDEYAVKLRQRLCDVHIGTLIRLAREHGWTPKIDRGEKRPDLWQGPEVGPVELPPPPAPYAPPPLDVLPQVLRDYVQASAACLDVSASYVFQPLLSSTAAHVGNSRSILLKRGYVEPPIIWTGVIGLSGSLKSPAIASGCFASMEVERELGRQNKEANEMYEDEIAAWKNSNKKLRGPEPEKPSLRRHVTDDLTIEVLADLLATNPRGVLIRKDELSQWYASFDQYRSGKGSDVGDGCHSTLAFSSHLTGAVMIVITRFLIRASRSLAASNRKHCGAF